ncbi:hypothetical protein GJ496_009342 [Pomphorhynchus laevis]|nr:hypothetical protein GJ496_009342 [Pomphorhynchus laevis]
MTNGNRPNEASRLSDKTKGPNDEGLIQLCLQVHFESFHSVASRRQSGISHSQRESSKNTDKHSQAARLIHVDQDNSSLSYESVYKQSERFEGEHSLVSIPTDNLKNVFSVKDNVQMVVYKKFDELEAVIEGEATLIQSQKFPDDWNNGPVKTLVQSNIISVSHDPSKAVLVEFYAPWCSICQRMKPVYNLLGTHFENHSNLFVAKIDATLNEIPSILIRSFPTIMLFPKIENIQPIVYGGNCT